MDRGSYSITASYRGFLRSTPAVIAVLVLFSVVPAWGQAPSIRVGPNVRINPSQTELPHVEPHAAVNPTDPNNVVAAAMVVHDIEGLERIHCVAFSTFDGGGTWQATDLNAIIDATQFDATSCADVWVAFSKEGTAFVSTLATPHPDAPRSSSLVFRSPDGGRTWAAPTAIPNGERGGSYDQEDVIVDNTDGTYAGTVYFSAVQPFRASPRDRSYLDAISVSRSIDGGRTFSDPIPAALSNLSLNELNMAILSDGTLIVSYHDYLTNQRSPEADGSSYRLLRPRLWMIHSSDGGETFSPPFLVAEVRQRHIPKIAADTHSDLFRDYLYAVWGDWGRTLDPTDENFYNPEKGVYFTRSTNRGVLWSRPIRIDRAPDPSTLRGTAALAVGGNGAIGVAWQDRRNDPTNKCQDLYFTASLDGGETFLPEVKVSSEISCPETPGNGAAGGRYPTGGEYFGLVQIGDSTFRAVWSDARSGVYQLYTSSIKVEGEVRAVTR